MITGKPVRPFSWSYFLEGEGHDAIWKKKLTSEQGFFLIDDVHFEVRKSGVGSGSWALVTETDIYARAKKTSAFKRRFELDGPMGSLLLGSVGMLDRSFYLGRGTGDLISLISPRNPLSRKVEITTHEPDYDFPTIVFAVWLVVIQWRRQGGG